MERRIGKSHRRDSRSSKVLAVLVTMVVSSALLMSPTPGAAEGTSEAEDPITMEWEQTNGADTIGMKTATLSQVFGNANRKATYGTDCKHVESAPKARWCFEKADNEYAGWMPQGVTSDADAQSDENWEGHKGLMVSWYAKDTGKGIRVTLLDTEKKRYRHLLLAVPPDDGTSYGADYEAINLHAGGIVWYGDRLYVADTYWGVRVFDLNNIYDLSADPHGDVEEKDKVGRDGDTFYGHGYRYVVPQLGRWKSPSKAEGGSGECQDDGPIHNSWLSLDRAAEPDRLVTGEFCAKAMDVPPGRVAMWNMKDHDIAADSDGVATSASVLELPRINEANHGANAQGGATTNGGGDWFFSISHGKTAGELRRYSRTDTDWVAKGT